MCGLFEGVFPSHDELLLLLERRTFRLLLSEPSVLRQANQVFVPWRPSPILWSPLLVARFRYPMWFHALLLRLSIPRLLPVLLPVLLSVSTEAKLGGEAGVRGGAEGEQEIPSFLFPLRLPLLPRLVVLLHQPTSLLPRHLLHPGPSKVLCQFPGVPHPRFLPRHLLPPPSPRRVPCSRPACPPFPRGAPSVRTSAPWPGPPCIQRDSLFRLSS